MRPERKTSKVIVLGGINADMVMTVGRLPVPGETVKALNYAVFPGGKGANQAVTCARMGAQVSLVSAIGDTASSKELLAELERAGVDVAAVVVKPGQPPGTALIFVDPDGLNMIGFTPGALEHLKWDEIENVIAQCNPETIFLAQLEAPFEIVAQSIVTAKRQGSFTVLNPAPAVCSEELTAISKFIDVLIPNEVEVGALAGVEVNSLEAAVQAIERLKARGFGSLVVTLGGLGVVAWTDDLGPLHIPAVQVDAVDTTAAGDVFVGAFCARVARGATLVEALDFANCAAALSVTRRGAMTSVPSLAEVERLVARQARTNKTKGGLRNENERDSTQRNC